jgi:hypothetical protein
VDRPRRRARRSALDEGALADPGLSLDATDRRPIDDRGEGGLELPELRQAADEDRMRSTWREDRSVPPSHGRLVAERPGDRRGRRSAVRVALQERQAQPVEVVWHTLRDRRRRARLALQLLHHHVQVRALERQLAAQRLVEHGAERVPVGRWTDGLAEGLLGSHVGERALHRPHRRRRDARDEDQAEVGDHGTALVGDQDVGRFHVAMDHAGLVERVEPANQLAHGSTQTRQVERLHASLPPHRGGARNDDLSGQPGRERRHVRRRGLASSGRAPAPDVVEDGAALDELHGEEPHPVGFVELAERHDVRVDELLGGTELALEAGEPARSDLPEHLEGDVDLLVAIEGLVHDSHAARADPSLDREAARTAEGAGRTHRSA